MKHVLALLLACLFALSLAGCGTEAANPLVTVDGPEDFKKTGVSIEAPLGSENAVYTIVDGKVAPITDDMEIEAIEEALANSKDNIRVHLSEALKLFSDKEHPDYRNSIKEFISAVEALCRELTGEDTLGKALKKLEDKGIVIQSQLKEAFIKLYAYTNQPDTGIRHSLMDDDATYHPSYNEAYFMLVACSAFVNYLRGVVSVKE